VQEEVLFFWANSDHCGDNICGNPIQNNKLIETNLKQLGHGSNNNKKCEERLTELISNSGEVKEKNRKN
jgi:hypothetical protein